MSLQEGPQLDPATQFIWEKRKLNCLISLLACFSKTIEDPKITRNNFTSSKYKYKLGNSILSP